MTRARECVGCLVAPDCDLIKFCGKRVFHARGISQCEKCGGHMRVDRVEWICTKCGYCRHVLTPIKRGAE